jgi:hypothetical protein
MCHTTKRCGISAVDFHERGGTATALLLAVILAAKGGAEGRKGGRAVAPTQRQTGGDS